VEVGGRTKKGYPWSRSGTAIKEDPAWHCTGPETLITESAVFLTVWQV